MVRPALPTASGRTPGPDPTTGTRYGAPLHLDGLEVLAGVDMHPVAFIVPALLVPEVRRRAGEKHDLGDTAHDA